MKLFFFLILFIVSFAQAQQAEQLIFNEMIHDFGNVDENAGNADFEFTFTNNSGRTITITSVSTSCGCTTPGWTKEPIENGKKGFVKASYNPKNRPGFFNKTLTVNTNLNGAPVVLHIKGNVSSEEINNDVSRLAATVGSLSMRAKEINFGKIYINRPAAVQEIVIYNSGSKTVRVDSILTANYLKVELPDSISAQQKVIMKVSYNAILRNQFGFLSDKIDVVTNDDMIPVKSFPVFATVEEFFLPVTSEDSDKIPVMSLETGTIDFGGMKMGSTVERVVKLRNTGKKELIIRFVQSNCPCITVTNDKLKVKPGEEAKVTIAWRSEGKHGSQNKAITIYSTDPMNPVQRVALTGDVN